METAKTGAIGFSVMAPKLYSIGFLAGIFQASPGDIRIAARAANVEPAMFLNDVAHFDEQGLRLLRCRLSRQERAKGHK
jgi:hypothetical protein